MNRFRKFAIAALMLFALGALAQQTHTAPSVDEHMQWLTSQLTLSADQQTRLRPIVQNMMDNMARIQQEQGLTDDARHQKLGALHNKAVKDAKQYLSAEQQQKLDELLKQHHPDAHPQQ